MDVENLRSKLKEIGQSHLLDFWHKLSEEQQRLLFDDIESCDLADACHQFRRTMTESGEKVQGPLDERLKPVPPEVLGGSCRSTDEQLRKYEQIGMEAVSRGEVAVLLLAGGQGTRLGVSYPKGMYDVGLPSHKTLFQLQAERLVKLQQLASTACGRLGNVVWYIMTSESTKEPTIQFFERHNYFGLNRENLVFFEQGTMPCFTFDGRVILETPSRLARAPDGNGGLYRALKRCRIVDDMKSRGVRYVHAYCVDNILVRMADPVFMGYCISRQADCGAKVVEKTVPTEAVGVVCQVDGKYQVVEYSEITLETAQKRNADNRLTFSAGNICNHFFSTDFLHDVVSEKEAVLCHHIAKKKIPYTDESGQTVKPEKPNGIKMEKFVFDVFQFSQNFAVWEVERDVEFSPLKNADGADKDTPNTCRWALCALHQRQVIRAGGALVDQQGQPLPLVPSNHETLKRWQGDMICEISPLVSYGGEGLTPLVAGIKFVAPLIINDPHRLSCAEDGR
nr:MMY-like protein 1 [Parasacculina yatsui]